MGNQKHHEPQEYRVFLPVCAPQENREKKKDEKYEANSAKRADKYELKVSVVEFKAQK